MELKMATAKYLDSYFHYNKGLTTNITGLYQVIHQGLLQLLELKQLDGNITSKPLSIPLLIMLEH